MHKVFSHLHGILEALEERPTHVGLELVEELFRACSDDLMRVEGAREVLLPLLRVAAECANIGADETRRLHLTYAYPRDPPSNTSSPIAPGRGGRRSSAATVDDLPAPVASDGVARAVSFATPAASPEKSAAMSHRTPRVAMPLSSAMLVWFYGMGIGPDGAKWRLR